MNHVSGQKCAAPRACLPELCKAVYDAKECAAALARQGKYVCGINFFWQDVLTSASPGVPMDIGRVRELGEWTYKQGPVHSPWMLHVRAPNASYNAEEHRGGLQRLSPEEGPHCTILKCASDIAHSCAADDPEDPLAQCQY